MSEKLRQLVKSLRKSRLMRDWGIACISSVLMYLAFYPANLSFLAWFALVPWLAVASQREPVRAGLISLAAGFVHFMLAISWIGVVTYSGLVLSALILAAFT